MVFGVAQKWPSKLSACCRTCHINLWHVSHLTPKYTLQKNINRLWKQGCEVDDYNNTDPNNILNTGTQPDLPTYKQWVQDRINWRKSEGHYNERDRLTVLGGKPLRGIIYLTNFFLFLLKFCIETVLLPQENNRIKGDPLSFGEFLCHIGLWILISCHIGYNRSFFWRIQLLFWEGRQFG